MSTETPAETLARLDEIRARTNEILNSSVWALMKPSAFMERLRDIPDLLALVKWQQEEIDTLCKRVEEATK